MGVDEYVEQRGEILESIEKDEEALRAAVHELTDAAAESLDVGQRIRQAPWVWLAAAFLAGCWLGHRPAQLSRRMT